MSQESNSNRNHGNNDKGGKNNNDDRPNITFNAFSDVLSGSIMAATSLPQLLSYAETVGYASWRGLSTAGPPLLVWGLVTGSPYMNAGVTSITALMTKSDLNGESYLQEYGEDAYVHLVAAYSLLCGIASILLASLRFGSLASWVPKPVRSGFKWGCSVGVLVSALPNGLFHTGSKQLKAYMAQDELWNAMIQWWKQTLPQATGAVHVTGLFYSITHPHNWSFLPASFFIVGTWFVMNGQKLLPKSIPPGTEVIVFTAITTWYSQHYEYSGGVVGEIPSLDAEGVGIPIPATNLSLPVEVLSFQQILHAPLAEEMGGWHVVILSSLLFAAINFLSIMGIASGLEAENGISWSPTRELLAQGVSCGVAALVGSAPVSGSLSRTLVSRMTGTTSQFACIVTATIWMVAMPYMSFMSATPKAALSAVIVSAVVQGVCIPKDLMKLRGLDSIVGWFTGIITAVTSPTLGFGLGLIVHFLIMMPFQSSATEKKKRD